MGDVARMRWAAGLLLLVTVLLLPVGVILRDSLAGSPMANGFSITPDTVSDSVAATPAQFRVSESGAATYAIPLFAVPGTAGVTTQRDAARAGVKRDLATLDQEAIETRAGSESVIQSPVPGIIATQLVKPGQAVQASQPLMAILPGDGRLQAELMVPSRAIGFIVPGDQVLLRYQSVPLPEIRAPHRRGDTGQS